MSEYLIVYERAEDGGWGAYLPDMPGVVALGETRAEVKRLIHEGVQIYLEEMGDAAELPVPIASAETISVG